MNLVTEIDWHLEKDVLLFVALDEKDAGGAESKTYYNIIKQLSNIDTKVTIRQG